MPRPRRSSTKKKVTRNPSSATKAQTNIVFGRWINSFIGVNVDEPNDAPALPIAAEKPFSVVRTSGGKVSAGRMKVVELGPKFEKKKVRP